MQNRSSAPAGPSGSPPRGRQPGTLPATGYVRAAQLFPGIVPASKVTGWRWVRDGKFPRPYKLGPRITAWKVEEVRAWMAEREGQANG